MSKPIRPMQGDADEPAAVRDLIDAGMSSTVEYDVSAGLARHVAHVKAGTPAPAWAADLLANGSASGSGTGVAVGSGAAWVAGSLLVGAVVIVTAVQTVGGGDGTEAKLSTTAQEHAVGSGAHAKSGYGVPGASGDEAGDARRHGATGAASPLRAQKVLADGEQDSVNAVVEAANERSRRMGRRSAAARRRAGVRRSAPDEQSVPSTRKFRRGSAPAPVAGGSSRQVARRTGQGVALGGARPKRGTEDIAGAAEVGPAPVGSSRTGASTKMLARRDHAYGSNNVDGVRPPEVLPESKADHQEPPRRPQEQARALDPEVESDRLEREMRMLKVAQAVLFSNPERALRLARQGEREFAGSLFAQERQHLLILSLVQLGRMDDAKRRAADYLHSYPRGPFSDRVRKALATGHVSR